MPVSINALTIEANALYQTTINIGSITIQRVHDFITKIFYKLDHDQSSFVALLSRLKNIEQRDQCLFAIASRLSTYYHLLRKAHGIITLIECKQSIQVNMELSEEQTIALKTAHGALDRFEVYNELKPIIHELRKKATFY